MRNHTARSARMLALVACLLMLLGVVAGCSSPKQATTSGLTADQKGQLEAIGKWYAAQGVLDVAAFKAGIYDPDDTLGVATLTAPPAGAKKSDVKWSWVGDTVVISVPADQTTITLSPSKTATNVVDVKDAAGGAGTYVMFNDKGVWKIDVVATQKAAAQGSAPTGETSGSVPSTTQP